jgi:hypothetical protein
MLEGDVGRRCWKEMLVEGDVGRRCWKEMLEVQPEPTQMHWFYCWRQHVGASHTVCLRTHGVPLP